MSLIIQMIFYEHESHALGFAAFLAIAEKE